MNKINVTKYEMWDVKSDKKSYVTKGEMWQGSNVTKYILQRLKSDTQFIVTEGGMWQKVACDKSLNVTEGKFKKGYIVKKGEFWPTLKYGKRGMWLKWNMT